MLTGPPDIPAITKLVVAAKELLELIKSIDVPGIRIGKRRLDQDIARANELINKNRLEDALIVYQDLMKKFPKSGRPVLGKIWIHMAQGRHIEALSLSGLAIALEEGNSKRTARAKLMIGQVHFEFFERYKGRQELFDAIAQLEEALEDDNSYLPIRCNLAQACATGARRCSKLRRQEMVDLQRKSNRYFDELIVEYRNRQANHDDFVSVEDFISLCQSESELIDNDEYKKRMDTLKEIHDIKRRNLPSLDASIVDSPSMTRIIVKYASIVAALSGVLGFLLLGDQSEGKTSPQKARDLIENVDSVSLGQAQVAIWKIGLQLIKITDRGMPDNIYVEEVREPERVTLARLSKPGSGGFTA